jgi:hypothetical protein
MRVGSVTPTAALITGVVAVVVALIGGFFGWRNSGRASMSSDQRAWLETAMKEARQAKADANKAEESAARAGMAAAEANRRSAEAEHRADDAERRLTTVTLQAEDLIGWISRVVRVAHEIDVNQVDDPAVRRLVDVINGGPPTLTADRLRVPRRK